MRDSSIPAMNGEKDPNPTREECLAIMEKEQMFPNIVRHSLMVEKVALFLTQALLQSGETLNLAEISAAALFHDLTKTKSLHTRENHACTGEQRLRELGFPRLGAIIRRHIEIPGLNQSGPVRPEEIVNYADKRVRHDEVVTLSERFEDLLQRYGRTPEACERILALKKQSDQLEQKVFSRIPLTPDDLLDLSL